MFGATTMATKRAQKGKDAGKVKREQSNTRLFWEQNDLLNELADLSRCSVAEAAERYLDAPLRDAIRKLYSDKLRSFESSSKSSRSTGE